MKYSFYYTDKKHSYIKTGLDSKEESLNSLKNIAFNFCNEQMKKAKGRIDETENRKLKTSERYDISYENNLLVFTRI